MDEAPVDPADETWGDESSTGVPKVIQPERRDPPVKSIEEEEPAVIRREERKSDNLRAGMQGDDFAKMLKSKAEPDQEAPEPAVAPLRVPLFDDKAW